MAQWQTAGAKQQFTKLVEAAEANGPQLVMRHKEPVAVVLSAEDYRRLKRQADSNFAALLKSSPMDGADLSGIGMSLDDDGEGGAGATQEAPPGRAAG